MVKDFGRTFKNVAGKSTSIEVNPISSSANESFAEGYAKAKKWKDADCEWAKVADHPEFTKGVF